MQEVEIKQAIQHIYSQRGPWVHKGQFGKLLVVAGSEKYTGSPIFNAMCALKSGCDLVTVATPKRVADILVGLYPDIITAPLQGKFLTPQHTNQILKLAEENDALLMGGGLGRELKTFKAILEIIKKCDLPMVLDADVLRALEGNLAVLKGKRGILTPHADEFRSLFGQKVSSDLKERKEKSKLLAQKTGFVIILKGHVDVITDGQQVFENKTGSAQMTKGGFGDCLAGICGALVSRGVDLVDAARAACYLNGKAGELASKLGGEGVLASDVFKCLPKVIKDISNDQN